MSFLMHYTFCANFHELVNVCHCSIPTLILWATPAFEPGGRGDEKVQRKNRNNIDTLNP